MPGHQVHEGLASALGGASSTTPGIPVWAAGPASEQRPCAPSQPPVAAPRSGVVHHTHREDASAQTSSAASGEARVDASEHGLHIERLLAEGGMGAVYAARRLETGERVALKVLRWEHVGSSGIANRFVREVRFARRIDHPNVCPVLADGTLGDGRPFFLMPLYQGSTLGEEVRRRGPLSVGRALAIADQILAGLAAMHAARVVHRDLQPDNVLLLERSAEAAGESDPAAETAANDAVTVKLIDLGFAHEPGVDTGDGLTPDSPGALVGTLRFMSPEQATRSRAITERSDLFSVALLIYYALTGELPFRGRTDLDVQIGIVRAAPIPLRRLRRDAPRALEQALGRALAKHPDARFGSASEMRAALAAIASAERAAGAHPRRVRSLH